MGFGSSRRRVESRLKDAVAALAAARSRVEVAEQQLSSFLEDEEEARIRALSSDNTADRRAAHAAAGHAELMRADLERARAAVVRAERRRDELLAEWGETS